MENLYLELNKEEAKDSQTTYSYLVRVDGSNDKIAGHVEISVSYSNGRITDTKILQCFNFGKIFKKTIIKALALKEQFKLIKKGI